MKMNRFPGVLLLSFTLLTGASLASCSDDDKDSPSSENGENGSNSGNGNVSAVSVFKSGRMATTTLTSA